MPRRDRRGPAWLSTARRDAARRGTARHDNVVEPGVSRGIAQASSAPRARSRARGPWCMRVSRIAPSCYTASEGKSRGAPRTIRRRTIHTAIGRTAGRIESIVRLVGRNTSGGTAVPRLADPATSGAALTTGSGVYLNKSRRLKSSGVHSLTGLHPQHGTQREERETRRYARRSVW